MFMPISMRNAAVTFNAIGLPSGTIVSLLIQCMWILMTINVDDAGHDFTIL